MEHVADRKLAAHMATFYSMSISDALHHMEKFVNADDDPSEWKLWAELLQSRLASLQKNLATAYPEQFKGENSNV